jgi:putative transposase
MEAEFCVQALEQALEGGKKPDIFNTDQGVQFTSQAFTGLLESQDIRISMDGRGRFADNIFVERLWRTVKYEEVYIKDYESITEARKNLDEYFDLYNRGRPHSALGNATPEAVYLGLAQAPPVPPRKLKAVAA